MKFSIKTRRDKEMEKNKYNRQKTVTNMIDINPTT